MENLLYGLMMVSGNDAAVCLAEYISGSIDEFANKMNEKALELGLTSSHFSSPHGLDKDDHYTTAYELAIITNYALQNKTFSNIVNTTSYTVYINGKPKALRNTNELLGYLDGVYGVKTGFTNGANRCLVTSCKRGNLDIICVVLGCDTKKDRTLDSIKLINYTFANFSLVNIKDIIYKNFDIWKEQHYNTFNINKSISTNLDLYLNEQQIPYDTMAINNNATNSIFTPISYIANYKAPLNKDTVIGQMIFKINDKSYFSIDILNKNAIHKKDTWYYFWDLVKNYYNYLTHIS